MRSPPIALAILLIALLFSVAGIVQIWLTIEERAGKAIQIQNVNFEGLRTIIYVQNVGKKTVTMDSVYINQERFDINITNCIITSEKTTTIREGQTAEITLNNAYKEKIHIKVVCKDGTFIEADWKP